MCPRGRFGCISQSCVFIPQFLEDVTLEKYCLDRREHRELAALWLGTVHTSAVQFSETVTLPDRGAAHYLNEMQRAHVNIVQHLDSPSFTDSDQCLLQTILSYFGTLRSQWDDIQVFCTDMPRTLVHGDLVVKNVQVRTADTGSALLPFDWGSTAGWGLPRPTLPSSRGAR